MKNGLMLVLPAVLLSLHTTAQNDIKAYNNYDFVPGDTILFEDNFSSDQDGEFPAHWDLISGQGVVNKMDDKTVFRLTQGNYVKVKPLMKKENYLSDPFTLEFDFNTAPGTYDIKVFFRAADGDKRDITLGHHTQLNNFSNPLSAEYTACSDADFKGKWHHAAIVYKNGQMKCYIDQYRILVIPHCGFVPLSLEFGGIGSDKNPLTFTNVRIAAGGGMNMLGKILTDGKLITHAITFDVNKAVIKAESMGFLNQLADWLKQNPSVKLEIDGHTDSDGDDASNMKLSQARAEAVKALLMSLGIEDKRLSTKGFGESKPIADNATPEGKANNRRVELVKMP